jgi:GNAT superfamily N-acetyltransferase
MSELSLRFATPDDASGIFRLVSELAKYENLEHEVISGPDDFQRTLEDPKSKIEVLLGFWSGEMVAFALFFENFSTFLGKPGLYLEDLFVQPEFRAKGIGTALMTRLIEIAQDRKYGRVEWAVLDWNEPAIKFYTERIGARLMSPWRICRLVLE